MGLEKLCAEIEDDSRKRSDEIIKQAQKEAKEILSSAKQGAKSSVEAAKAQAKKFSRSESEERITAAQLEAQKLLSEARDEAVKKSLSQAWEQFSDAKKLPQYQKKLRAWAQKALDELSLPGAVVQCNQADRQALLNAGFKLSPEPIECAGGARAASRDGKIVVDYTLEAQFDQKKEELSRKVHSILFAGETGSLAKQGAKKQGAKQKKAGSKKAKAKKIAGKNAKKKSSRKRRGGR
ncbi:hypothetical protein COU37_04660 [Candidatus Micrarchaeota archaeon CG10_big_fil_rev_8_21_14_0_10_45_29]|nr:MAG: hypothetical protein COU37_04660 [Candidatus Micrarchaeota archaeon CG10_big_fil_rev_8_21_14_0_10_45_29]